jgi:hypothetical protein
MKIQKGQILKARSIGDQDCIFTVEVLDRKGSFITVKTQHGIKRVKVMGNGDDEFIYALGRYSMAPIFRAPSPAPSAPSNLIQFPG